MDPNTAWFGVVGGLAAVAFAVVLIFLVLSKPAGNESMRQIAAAIQEGAAAYLNRQYTVIAVIGVVIAVVIGFLINWKTAGLYIVGAVLSAVAGYVGMNIAVRANVRTAEAARGGVNAALQVAFLGRVPRLQGSRGAGGTCLRREPGLGLRPIGRWHLHQGG